MPIITTLPLGSHPPPPPGLKTRPRMQEADGLSFTASWTQGRRHPVFPKPPSKRAFVSSPDPGPTMAGHIPSSGEWNYPWPFTVCTGVPDLFMEIGVEMLSVMPRFILLKTSRDRGKIRI